MTANSEDDWILNCIVANRTLAQLVKVGNDLG